MENAVCVAALTIELPLGLNIVEEREADGGGVSVKVVLDRNGDEVVGDEDTVRDIKEEGDSKRADEEE